MRRMRLRTRNRSTIHAGTRTSSAVTRSATESTLPVPVNRHARRGCHRCGETVVGAAWRLARLVPHGSGRVGPDAGDGYAKSVRLKAALEPGRRLVTLSPDERPQMGSPEGIVNLLGIEMVA